MNFYDFLEIIKIVIVSKSDDIRRVLNIIWGYVEKTFERWRKTKICLARFFFFKNVNESAKMRIFSKHFFLSNMIQKYSPWQIFRLIGRQKNVWINCQPVSFFNEQHGTVFQNLVLVSGTLHLYFFKVDSCVCVGVLHAFEETGGWALSGWLLWVGWPSNSAKRCAGRVRLR